MAFRRRPNPGSSLEGMASLVYQDEDDQYEEYAYEECEKWCYTKSEEVELSYKWIINNFSYYGCETLNSSKFFADGFETILWSLSLIKNKEKLTPSLHLVTCKVPTVRAKIKLSVGFSTGENGELFSSVKHLISGGICTSDRVWDIDPRTLIEKGDVLEIFCKIKFVVDVLGSCGRSNVKLPKCTLIEDLEKMFCNEELCDVTFLVDDHKFPAHKAFLAVRSEYFSAMFKNDMKESQLDCIPIEDVTHEAFREFLRFVYTGKVDNLKKISEDLLSAADRFRVEKLKVMCEKSLCASLSTKTAPKLLALADMYSAHQLKKNAMDFINIYASKITVTNDWKLFSEQHPSLIIELYMKGIQQ